MTVLSTKIPFALKNRISKFADAINVSQSRIFVEALTRYLDGDAQSLSTVENLIGRINLLEKQSEATLSRLAALEATIARQPPTIQKQPSEDAPQGIPIKTPVRSDTPICSKCGSSDIARWGKGRLRSDGSQGRRVMCGGCGKISTIG